MRRIVVTQMISLDGIVDNEQSWFDPSADTAQNAEMAEVTRQHAAASDGFLVGRVTFEEMRGFWPEQVDDHTGVTDHLNRVATSSPRRWRTRDGTARRSCEGVPAWRTRSVA